MRPTHALEGFRKASDRSDRAGKKKERKNVNIDSIRKVQSECEWIDRHRPV